MTGATLRHRGRVSGLRPRRAERILAHPKGRGYSGAPRLAPLAAEWQPGLFVFTCERLALEEEWLCTEAIGCLSIRRLCSRASSLSSRHSHAHDGRDRAEAAAVQAILIRSRGSPTRGSSETGLILSRNHRLRNRRAPKPMVVRTG